MLGRTDEFRVVVVLVVEGRVAVVDVLFVVVPGLPSAALDEEVLLVPNELREVVALFLVRLPDDELPPATTLF